MVQLNTTGLATFVLNYFSINALMSLRVGNPRCAKEPALIRTLRPGQDIYLRYC
jgi:hypothetical protein